MTQPLHDYCDSLISTWPWGASRGGAPFSQGGALRAGRGGASLASSSSSSPASSPSAPTTRRCCPLARRLFARARTPAEVSRPRRGGDRRADRRLHLPRGQGARRSTPSPAASWTSMAARCPATATCCSPSRRRTQVRQPGARHRLRPAAASAWTSTSTASPTAGATSQTHDAREDDGGAGGRRCHARYWVEINRLLVPFGKHICTGALPHCSTCPVLAMCRQVGVRERR